MQISEAADVTGVSARALRYYEAEGLIVSGRCANGFRDYCPSTIDRVLVIRELLESGLPVRLIREFLPHLSDGSDKPGGPDKLGGPDEVCPEFLAEVQSHRDRLAARIAILSGQQEALDAFLRKARPAGP